MTTLQKTLIAATVVASVGTGMYEIRQTSHLRDQNQTLQQQQTPIANSIQQLSKDLQDATRQLAALRDDNERLKRNIAEVDKLRGELARLRRDSEEFASLKAGNANTPTDVAMKDWLRRTSLLKQYLEQMPDKGIPELQFCTEEDWVGAVKDHKLANEEDVRDALNGMRQNGKEKFSDHIHKALGAYIQANAGYVPTDFSQLKPYFDIPVTDDLIQRYVMLRTGKASDLKGKWLITEKAPADVLYDTRGYIGINDGMTVGIQGYSKGVTDPDEGAQIK